MLLCLPCACLNGILAGFGFAAMAYPDFETGISATENTYFTGLFSAMALVSLAAGTLLLIWALRTQRQPG